MTAMTVSWNRFRAHGIRLVSILKIVAGMAAPAAGASAVKGGSPGAPAAPAATAATGTGGADVRAAASPGDRKGKVDLVDLNRATEKQLTSLPGVGPATARKIIAGRPYGSVEELARAGVPAKTIRAIAPLVTAAGQGRRVPSS